MKKDEPKAEIVEVEAPPAPSKADMARNGLGQAEQHMLRLKIQAFDAVNARDFHQGEADKFDSQYKALQQQIRAQATAIESARSMVEEISPAAPQQ